MGARVVALSARVLRRFHHWFCYSYLCISVFTCGLSQYITLTGSACLNSRELPACGGARLYAFAHTGVHRPLIQIRLNYIYTMFSRSLLLLSAMLARNVQGT